MIGDIHVNIFQISKWKLKSKIDLDQNYVRPFEFGLTALISTTFADDGDPTNQKSSKY